MTPKTLSKLKRNTRKRSRNPHRSCAKNTRSPFMTGGKTMKPRWRNSANSRENYLSKLRNDLDEPHNRNQELRNQNEELNMNVKDLETICEQLSGKLRLWKGAKRTSKTSYLHFLGLFWKQVPARLHYKAAWTSLREILRPQRQARRNPPRSKNLDISCNG